MRYLSKPIKILQVYGSLSRGGAETWLMDIMRNTSRQEFQFNVCLVREIEGAYQEEFKDLGGRVYFCPLSKNLWSFSRRFKKILRTEGYDILHSHLYYFSGFLLRQAFQAGISKRVAHIHPAEDFKADKAFRRLYAFWMKRWIVLYGTGFVGPTKASLKNFWGPEWQKDESKKVIYNCVDVKRFSKKIDTTKIRGQLRIPEGAKIVLNVSRYSPHKRHEFLVEVAGHVLSKRKDVYFVLIGAGDLKGVIEGKVREKKLSENFRFISGAPSIDQYYLASDVFAFPSCNEGFGIVIAEAALAGLKVMAQDIPGVREAAEVCPDVVLLPVDTSPDSWALKLLSVLDEPKIEEKRYKMFLRQFPFTIENSISTLREVYGV